MSLDNYKLPQLVDSGDPKMPPLEKSEPDKKQEAPKAIGGELATEHLREAEKMVGELIADGKRQAESAEESIGLPSKDIEEVREKVSFSKRLRQIQAKIQDGFLKFKNSISNFLPKEENNQSEEEFYGEIIRQDHEEVSSPMIQEAIGARDHLLTSRGLLQMSKEDFDKYFGSGEFGINSALKQGNFGDCYIVASIHAMSCSPHFEMICRASMKRISDGSWEVKLPLLGQKGESFKVSPEDLLPKKNEKSKNPKWYDQREELSPLQGPEGFQVLEAAIIKKEKGSLDRSGAEGGFSSKALMSFLGENFICRGMGSSIQYDKKNKRFSAPSLSSFRGEKKACLDYYLDNFDPKVFIGTTSIMTNSVKKEINGRLEFFPAQHIYSIAKVDKQNKIITISNPWDTSREIALPFDMFKDIFSHIYLARINSAKFLENIAKIGEETA